MNKIYRRKALYIAKNLQEKLNLSKPSFAWSDSFSRSTVFIDYWPQFLNVIRRNRQRFEIPLNKSLSLSQLEAQPEGIGIVSMRTNGPRGLPVSRNVARYCLLAMPPGTLVVGGKRTVSRIESRPDHRVFECTSARLGTRNCFDIELVREERLQRCGNS